MIAERIRGIGMSPTLRISALAARLRAAGEDVLDFSAGEPDFPTPEEVKQAGKRAIDSDLTRYTANEGVLELREAVIARLRSDHDLHYGPEQVIVSPGAKASLYFAAMALLDPGDEVVIPSPYWVTYPEQTRLAQATPVFVECDEERGFKLDPEALERAVNPRTKALVLNYPSNPTGACYTRDELKPLADICVRHGIWVVADEIYAKLIYDDRVFSSIAELGHDVRERTVVIGGMSKTYSMTGWRVGFAAGPAEVIGAMSKIQSHTTSNATSISQWASVDALALDDEVIEGRRKEFETRRNEVVRRLRALPGWSCVMPAGAFYAFPNVSGCLRRDGSGPQSPEELARLLLERARVAVVPGEAFGSEAHVRISYATSLETIREGMDRVQEALEAIAAG